ncbi:hypothetical protein MHBO_001665 [Bonamia ostreae]|uniref:FRIGIDA-like protein n=1 Tax=Bonamia ostreae TaxID=126728 RepID=A0ABV2AJS2_9EUKA
MFNFRKSKKKSERESEKTKEAEEKAKELIEMKEKHRVDHQRCKDLEISLAIEKDELKKAKESFERLKEKMEQDLKMEEDKTKETIEKLKNAEEKALKTENTLKNINETLFVAKEDKKEYEKKAEIMESKMAEISKNLEEKVNENDGLLKQNESLTKTMEQLEIGKNDLENKLKPLNESLRKEKLLRERAERRMESYLPKSKMCDVQNQQQYQLGETIINIQRLIGILNSQLSSREIYANYTRHLEHLNPNTTLEQILTYQASKESQLETIGLCSWYANRLLDKLNLQHQLISVLKIKDSIFKFNDNEVCNESYLNTLLANIVYEETEAQDVINNLRQMRANIERKPETTISY